MAYPGNNVKRRNRRALGKGQVTAPPSTVCTITGAGSTVTYTFSAPVNIAGTIPMAVATRTFVSQAIVSPTVVTQLYSGALTGLAWILAQPIPNVSSYEGGVIVSVPSGTF